MPILTVPTVQSRDSFSTIYTDSRDIEHPVEITYELSPDSEGDGWKTVTNYWYFFPATTPKNEDICKDVRELIRLHMDCTMVSFL